MQKLSLPKAQEKKELEPTEARLQQDCVVWFRNTYPHQRYRLIMIHNNPRSAIDGTRLIGMGMMKGASDLIYLRESSGITVLPHFLECKLPMGYMSPEQKVFQSRVQGYGWKYDVFRSLEEFQKLINAGE